jgi:hypothetical protein
MKRIDVVKTADGWVGETKTGTVAKAPTKDEAVKRTADVAKAEADAVTVKIHKANGRIQEERTYPRSADPPQSKG